jgi:PIN domain nuclease of toxin-antitoxin system
VILLDTNALLWVVRDDSALGALARGRIDEASRVHYSPVSITEITIKHMLGRIALPGGEEFPTIFARSGLVELPFVAEHAASVAQYPTLVRHDPFDRMLLAQARVERMALITSDQVLLALGEPWIVDARR